MEKVIVADVLDAQEAFEYLVSKELPAKIAFRLKSLGRKFRNVVRDYSETADSIREQLSEFEEEHNRWVIPPRLIMQLNQQLRDLRMAEVEMTSKRLKGKEFVDSLAEIGEDEGNVSSNVFIDLWFFFEEETE